MNRTPIIAAAAVLVFLLAVNAGAESESVLAPFEHVDGFVPGVTTVAEVEERLGPSEAREQTRSGYILRYPGRGFHFIADLKGRPMADDATVDAVYVEPPYEGRMPQGLHLGMDKSEALEILDRHYHLDMNIENSCYYYAQREGGESDFTVWFENGRLARMKLWPRSDW